jgi:calcium-activated chloride channel regulator 3/4
VPDDGVYSASVPYTVDGSYSVIVTASNADGKARTTLEGVLAAPTEDGSPVPAFEPTPITENFVRVGSASATAAGVMRDDHTDDPAGGACTPILADNADTVGRIDFAGDMDCFTVVPTQVSDSMILRVTSLAAGMDPRLTVYDHTGTLLIAEADMAASGVPDSGLVLAVPSDVLDPDGVVFVVEHIDPLAATGNYAVSAGAPLTSDQPDEAGGRDPTDRTSSSGCSVAKGGALDPLLPLLFLAALTGLFLRQRRPSA